jgi:hypothetical protein
MGSIPEHSDRGSVRALDAGLTTEAARAAQQFQFEPGTLDGLPVPVIVSFEIEFSLEPK